ncbi:MAG: DUF547 domain-containing protein [Planctomycetes bacterium]|nr:DUF547 domain-containing protein [Planctomycetota bacterium]
MRTGKKIALGFLGTVLLLATGFRLRYGSNAPVFDEALYAVDAAPYRPFDAAAWARVLARRVDDQGRVDFAGLATDGADLERFLRQAAFLAPAELVAFSAEQRLGFWIDVFHAGVLRAVARSYPIEPDLLLQIPFPANSVKQIHRLKFFRREQLLVAGERITLQEIEDRKIWDEHRDLRSLFALHRAALSSPPIAREPYFGSALGERLDRQVRAFLASQNGVRWNEARKTLALSRLFEWNEARFLEAAGSGEEIPGYKAEGAAMLRFALHYAPAEQAARIRAGGFALDAFGFDWALTEARSR